MRRLKVGLAVILGAALTTFNAGAAKPVSSSFPMEYREGLIWLKIKVRGSAKPLNLLLDSGANVSVINISTARKLRMKKGQPVEVGGVDAATIGYWPEHLPVSDFTAPLPADFLAVDLSTLSRDSECPVDGLLGADFFARHAVRIDFARHKIDIDSYERPVGRQAEIPLRLNKGAPQVPLCVDGESNQWVRLDTGCNSALHWVSSKVPPAGYTPQVAVALTKISIPVTKTKVQLGPFSFEDVPTGIHSTEIFAGEAGLLGNGILDHFRTVTIDLPAQRLLLESSK